jgi:hypothetical protein
VLLENTQDQPSFFQPDLDPVPPRQNRCVVAGVNVSESLGVDIKQAIKQSDELSFRGITAHHAIGLFYQFLRKAILGSERLDHRLQVGH